VSCSFVALLLLNFFGQGIGPKVLLVEEAGQVLEAHILACLVPSVEHLICIGDPLQLRPTLNNYGQHVFALPVPSVLLILVLSPFHG
jgi:superfamily I DNA and/or RNA helicase